MVVVASSESTHANDRCLGVAYRDGSKARAHVDCDS